MLTIQTTAKEMKASLWDITRIIIQGFISHLIHGFNTMLLCLQKISSFSTCQSLKFDVKYLMRIHVLQRNFHSYYLISLLISIFSNKKCLDIYWERNRRAGSTQWKREDHKIFFHKTQTFRGMEKKTNALNTRIMLIIS